MFDQQLQVLFPQVMIQRLESNGRLDQISDTNFALMELEKG